MNDDARFGTNGRPMSQRARRCSTSPMARAASRKPSAAAARRAACRPHGLSFVAVEQGRVIGTVRLWHVTAGPLPAGAAARPARGASRLPQPRHRLGVVATCDPMRPKRAVTRAVLLVGDLLVLRPRRLFGREDRRAVDARAATSSTGCSRSSSSRARSTARAALSARPATTQAASPALDTFVAAIRGSHRKLMPRAA